jgi:catechol 2,3-dioxygenase-like lactoylglutathione lyase family enzyme
MMLLQSHHRIGPRQRQVGGLPGRYLVPSRAEAVGPVSDGHDGQRRQHRFHGYGRKHHSAIVSESEFDEIFCRIRDRKLTYWADPGQTKANEINRHDGGRGVYFEDPDGHLLEVITRPYGSGGWNP